MFLLLLLAASALVGIVLTVRAIVSDGPRRVPTRYSQVSR